MSDKRRKQIVRNMRASIETDVAAGFDTPAEIVEGVVYAYSDDIPAEILQPSAEKLVARAIQKHLETQAEWPTTTDCDRLDAAFADLEDHEILARQNCSDCITSGHDAMQEEVARAGEQGRAIRGYTFFHMQDTDLVVETGILHLAFGTGPASDEEVALAYLPQLLENGDAPILADREQPVRFKQEVIQTWQKADPAFPVPSTVAEALRVLQGMVKTMPLLRRLGVMSTAPRNELAVFKVANEVLDTLRRHGLDATWDGLSERRIEVRMDWKRRRDLIGNGHLEECEAEDVPTSGHKTVPVRWKNLDAQIDENIAPLVLELWKADLLTCNSCEGNRSGWVWIEFYFVHDAELFLDIVAEYEEEIESLYNRIRNGWSPAHGELEGVWEYRASVDDMAVEATEVDGVTHETSTGPSDFVFALTVRFPRSDLPTVLERMQRHNETNERTRESK